MMQSQNYNKLFLVFILAFGIIVGKGINHIPYFNISNDINLLELGSLVLSILVAYWISVYFINRSNVGNAEKELLFKVFDEIDADKSSLTQLLVTTPLSYQEVTKTIKRLRKGVKRLETLTGKVSLSLGSGFCKVANDRIKEINKLSTMSSPVKKETSEQLPIFIMDDSLILSASRLEELEAEFERLSERLFEMKVDIIQKCNGSD
jgi:SMC interacting uncharacterized protein involved in chromosome segregation